MIEMGKKCGIEFPHQIKSRRISGREDSSLKIIQSGLGGHGSSSSGCLANLKP
jgi:hypothetical protein